MACFFNIPHEKSSFVGKLLIDFLEKGDYVLVNASRKCKNGPFTRYDRTDPKNETKMSVLDLIIVSKEIEQYVVELNIDKELQWTPSRNYKGQLKFPDHFALLLTLNIPMANTKHIPTKKNIIWNTKKQNGWERYKAITENNKELDRATNMNLMIQKLYGRLVTHK